MKLLSQFGSRECLSTRQGSTLHARAFSVPEAQRQLQAPRTGVLVQAGRGPAEGLRSGARDGPGPSGKSQGQGPREEGSQNQRQGQGSQGKRPPRRDEPQLTTAEVLAAWAALKESQQHESDPGQAAGLAKSLLKSFRPRDGVLQSKEAGAIFKEMVASVMASPQLDLRNAVQIAWCVGESGPYPGSPTNAAGRAWASSTILDIYSWIERSPELASITPSGSSTLLYAAGVLESALPPPVLDATLAAVERSAGSASPVMVCSVLHGLAKTGNRTAFQRAEAVLRPSLVRRLYMGQMQSGLAISTLWAFRQMNVRPDPALLEGLLFSIKSSTREPEPKGLVTAMQSLSSFKDKERFADLARTFEPTMVRWGQAGQLAPRFTVDILQEYAMMEVQPSPEFVRTMVATIAAAKPTDLRGKAVPYLLWSLAKLDLADDFAAVEEKVRPGLKAQLERGDVLAHNVGGLFYAYGRVRQYIDREICILMIEKVEELQEDFSFIAAASTLWGLARLGAQELFCKAESMLVAGMVEKARSGDMSVRALDNTLWAYAEMGVSPPPELVALFDQVTEEGGLADDETAFRLATWMYVKAVLTQVPTARQLEHVGSVIRERGEILDMSKSCLLSWSLGVMLCASPGIALQPAFWDCWRAVAQCIRPESADAVRSTSLVQLYHSHLMLQASAPAGRRDEVALPQWALDKGREHWLAASGEGVGARPGPKSLELQASIAGAFDAIGLRPRLDVTTEDKLFRVDLAIRLQDGTKLAVCIDGPLQFCRNTGRKLGTAYARDRLLEARGWEVLSIPVSDWELLKVPNKQGKYLKARLGHHELPSLAA